MNLEFQNIKTHKNITTKCSLYKVNNIIKCNLDEIINSNYSLYDYLDFNNNELVLIVSDNQNSYPMTCLIRYNNSYQKSSGISKGALSLIIIIIIIAILISAGLAYFIFNRYHQSKTIKSSSEQNFDCPSSSPLED